MKFGLEQHIIDELIAVFEENPKVDKALVFGSRAKGNFRSDSDIDIAIKGQELNTDDIIAMSVAFEEKGITNKIDLINYHTIKEPDLKDHIDRVGIEFYSRWKEIPLSKTTKFIVDNRGKTVPTSKTGIPLIATNCINNNSLYPIYSNVRYISQEIFDNWFRSHPQPGDIILTLKGSQNGAVCLVPDPVGFAIAQDMVALRVNEKVIDPHFLFAALRSPEVQNEIKNLDVSGVIPHLKKSDFDKLLLPYPDMVTQKIIGSIYFSLSNKIDLLHRQNKTLEQLAETLFRQWFVEEAEESWEVVRLEKLGKIICGKTPSKKVSSYFNGEYPFIKIPDMYGNTYVFESIDSLTEQGLNSQQNKTIPPKSICVSCIATVGLVVMNAKTSQTNQQINSIIPSKDIYRYFIYLKMLSIKDELLAMASGGTATDNLNTGDFSKIEIQFPRENVLKEFHEKVSPMFDKIYTNQTQIRTLTHTRDALLPKLMSGEIRTAI